MMSHNRLVFVASFAIVALMAVGLEVCLQGPLKWRWWFWLPAALLAGLLVYDRVHLGSPLCGRRVSGVRAKQATVLLLATLVIGAIVLAIVLLILGSTKKPKVAAGPDAPAAPAGQLKAVRGQQQFAVLAGVR